MDRRTDWWTDGRTDQRTERWTDGWTDPNIESLVLWKVKTNLYFRKATLLEAFSGSPSVGLSVGWSRISWKPWIQVNSTNLTKFNKIRNFLQLLARWQPCFWSGDFCGQATIFGWATYFCSGDILLVGRLSFGWATFFWSGNFFFGWETLFWSGDLF